MPPLSPFFLLPHGCHIHVARHGGHGLEWIARTPWSAAIPAALSSEGRLAALSRNGARLATGHLDGGRFMPGPTHELPRRYHGLCVTVVGAHAFVGGRCGHDMVGRVPLDGPDAGRWEPLPKPHYLRIAGKAVDALAVRGNRLYAVDNVCLPKFVLTYWLDTPTPQLAQVAPLPAHGPYEQVKAAALGDGFLAVLSTSVGRGGASCHVSRLHCETLEELDVLRLHRSPSPEGPSLTGETAPGWQDIAVTGQILWIAAGSGGLLLAEAGSEAPPVQVPALAPGPIVRVVATPAGGLVAVAENAGCLVPILLDQRRISCSQA
jgi:hypothetical protein